MLIAMASATLNSGRCDVYTNAAIFHELLMVKPHEILMTDQFWVVESDWSVEIQLKMTCAGPLSCHALAPTPTPTRHSEKGLA